jgi:hypothetical protein
MAVGWGPYQPDCGVGVDMVRWHQSRVSGGAILLHALLVRLTHGPVVGLNDLGNHCSIGPDPIHDSNTFSIYSNCSNL